jgi:GWxTD domain-containing protein
VLTSLWFVFLAGFQGAAELSDDHRRWLDDEVAYIITDEERELFLSLATLEERDRAIEAFWHHRDPDRLTPANEFRDEHYRRLAEADRLFGGGVTRAGSKTERGRYFVILGEPFRIDRFVGSNEVVSSELWFYNGSPARGLPPRFNLVFFKENDIGDYFLYSPLDDGPSALLHSSVWMRNDRNDAVDVLEVVSMDLARASLTVDLTEAVGAFLGRNSGLTPDGRAENPAIPLNVRPSQGANNVIASVLESATRGVDTDYVEGYRLYGSRVDSDYSFNYVSSRDYWTVLYEPDEMPFVHFAIELDPKDATFRRNEDGTAFETRLQVDIEVRPRAGGTIAIPSRDPYIRLSPDQIEAVSALPVSYQDSFPLIPGAYQVAVTLRNLAGEEFTVVERNLSVATLAEARPALGGVALGYDLASPGEEGSFASEGFRVLPAGRARFSRGDSLQVFAQLVSPGDGSQAPVGSIRVSVNGDAGVILQQEIASPGSVAVAAIPLDGIAPGAYSILFDLLDTHGDVTMTNSSAFELVDGPALPRPALIYRNVVARPESDITALLLSEQHLSRGDIIAAERALRSALGVDSPRAEMVRWKLASVLLYTGQGAEALELLAPLEPTYPEQPEVVEGLGFAYYLQGNCEMALPRLELAMALRPPEASLLNAAGDCFEQVGRPEKAREMFELSLSVNPGQEAVRARLATLAEP